MEQLEANNRVLYEAFASTQNKKTEVNEKASGDNKKPIEWWTSFFSVITTIATVIMAGYTGLLYRATDKMWAVARYKDIFNNPPSDFHRTRLCKEIIMDDRMPSRIGTRGHHIHDEEYT